MTDSRKITDDIHEQDYELSIRNHKDEPIVLRVVEHPYGYWTVRSTTHEFEKVEAHRIEFDVPVEVDGEVFLRYTVRTES